MAAAPSLRDLHPRHGIHEPSSGTPARTPGSVRRTTTIDMLRPDGLERPLVLVGRGQDIRTGPGGELRVITEAGCRGVVDFVNSRKLTEFSSDPVRPLGGLIGARVASGFRGLLDAADPVLAAEHNLLYLMLDDFPVAALVAGHALLAARAPGPALPPPDGRYRFTADLCSGFVSGGTIMSGVAETGLAPAVTGPLAPPLVDPEDVGAWHPTAALPPQAMRRARRIDVRPGPRPDDTAAVDALFRDTYVLPDGTETVIHEYAVTAEVDTRTGTLTACRAVPHVLPWVECPAAAAGAGRLAGQPLAGLRRHVRDEFTGISTCTHLNDTLRALEDVPALLRLAATRG